MSIIKKDTMKEFLKCYLSSICFDIEHKIRTKIHIMLIVTQLLTLIAFIILKIVFKNNQLVYTTISIIYCIICWLCLLFVIGTSYIVEKVRTKNQPRIDSFYKYLDNLIENDLYEQEMNPIENDDEKTNKDN